MRWTDDKMLTTVAGRRPGRWWTAAVAALALAVLAACSQPTQPLTLTFEGTGGGRVNVVVGIGCDENCSVPLPQGTTVTLLPVPDEGSSFAGWGGACSGISVCSVTMSEARAVTATFSLIGTERPAELTELSRVSDGVPFTGTVENCVVNGLSMPGQGLNAIGAGLNAIGAGLNAIGAVGGLFLFEPGSAQGAPEIRLFDPAEAATLAAGLVSAFPQDGWPEDVAILIVDDFGAGLTLPAGLTSPAADLSLAAFTNLVNGGVSHGALVMHQVLEMVAAAGFQPSPTQASSTDFQVFARPFEEQRLIVAAVDTAGFDTTQIAERVGAALDALGFYGEIINLYARRVVVNMSFVLVPCEVLTDYDLAAMPSFEDYVLALGLDNLVAEDFYGELVQLLVEPLVEEGVPEPLRGFTDEIESCAVNDFSVRRSATVAPTGFNLPTWSELLADRSLTESYPWCSSGGTAVFVASSGNYGLPYPMYPAAWPLVIGVSSQDGAEPTGFSADPSSFSNAGEVMAPGALFELGRSPGGESVIGYAGTSFAAPVVAFFSALDLLRPSPACAFGSTAYLTNAPDTGNQPLGEAIAEHCVSSPF